MFPLQHSCVPAVGQGIPFLEVKREGHPPGGPWLGAKGVSPLFGDMDLETSLGFCGLGFSLAGTVRASPMCIPLGCFSPCAGRAGNLVLSACPGSWSSCWRGTA